MMHRGFLITCGLIAAGLLISSQALAGAACVVVKEQGNSIDIAWATVPGHASLAQDQAEASLRSRGHKRLFNQALSELDQGYGVILRSRYKNARGRDRTSYGCGFSAVSFEEAHWAALRDLQSYAWGWKPDREGYEVMEQFRF